MGTGISKRSSAHIYGAVELGDDWNVRGREAQEVMLEGNCFEDLGGQKPSTRRRTNRWLMTKLRS